VSIHAPARTPRSSRPTRPVGWVPFALVALVLIPAIAGSLRLRMTPSYPRQPGTGPTVRRWTNRTTTKVGSS
jgi:hypothetical protein